MKRTPLRRSKPLTDERGRVRRRPISPASPAQREHVRDQPCLVCGAEVTADGWGRFCSRGCAGKWAHQNRLAYPPESEVRSAYAELRSMAALGARYGHSGGWAKTVLAHYGIPEVSRRVTLACQECGCDFEVSASRITYNRKYCSRACWNARDRRPREAVDALARRLSTERLGAGNPAYKHGKSEKGRPGRLRWHLRLKGEAACRNCGQPASHLHHIVPRSKAKIAREEVETNGLPLCAGCHRGWHDRKVTIHHDVLTDAEFGRACELAGVLWLERNYPDHGDVALMRLDELINQRKLRPDRPETIDERLARLSIDGAVVVAGLPERVP